MRWESEVDSTSPMALVEVQFERTKWCRLDSSVGICRSSVLKKLCGKEIDSTFLSALMEVMQVRKKYGVKVSDFSIVVGVDSNIET